MTALSPLVNASLVILLFILMCLLIVYTIFLAVSLASDSLVYIRFLDKSKEGICCITMPYKVDTERSEPIWLEFSGDGTASDVSNEGFVFECRKGPKKSMCCIQMFKNSNRLLRKT